MIRRPPRSTPLYSSAASDVYKRQKIDQNTKRLWGMNRSLINNAVIGSSSGYEKILESVSYTHLRAHETPEHLVCRLLLEKKKKKQKTNKQIMRITNQDI